MSRLATRLFDRYAEHYTRVNPSILSLRTPNELRWFERNYGTLVKNATQQGPVDILDLGCGVGKLLACLDTYPKVRPIGVDISASQIALAQKALPKLSIECGDGLEFLTRNPRRFAGIICNDVLEHLETLDDCLTWIEAVVNALVPGGFFACRAPNGANVLASYSRYMDLTHHRCFTSTSIVQLLEAGGLVDAKPVQFHGSTWREGVRLRLQDAAHLALFHIVGHRSERYFTSNIHAIAFRALDRHSP